MVGGGQSYFPFPENPHHQGRISCSSIWTCIRIQLESEKLGYICLFTPIALAGHNGLALAQNLSSVFHMCKVYCNSISPMRSYNLMAYYISHGRPQLHSNINGFGGHHSVIPILKKVKNILGVGGLVWVLVYQP